jgi:hypothetical protein
MFKGKDFLLYHHSGFGDFLSFNGLVRKLYHDMCVVSSYENFYLMTPLKWAPQVEFMYRDLERMNLVDIPDDTWGCPTVEIPHIMFDDFPGGKIRLGMWQQADTINMPPDDRLEMIHELYWYDRLGYPASVKHDWFRVDRDLDRENQVYTEIVGNDSDDYVFVADDARRNYIIDVTRVYPNSDYRIIRASDWLDYSLFDLLGVMNRAKSCHLMWSSFDKLCDGLNPGFTQIYLHETYLNAGAGKIGHMSPSAPAKPVYDKFLASRNIVLV